MGSGFVTLKVFVLFCFDSFIGTGECQRGGSGENDLSPDGQGSRSSWARYEELHLVLSWHHPPCLLWRPEHNSQALTGTATWDAGFASSCLTH